MQQVKTKPKHYLSITKRGSIGYLLQDLLEDLATGWQLLDLLMLLLLQECPAQSSAAPYFPGVFHTEWDWRMLACLV